MIVTVVLHQMIIFLTLVIKLSSFELALVSVKISRGDLSWRPLILGLIDFNIAFVLVFSVLVNIIVIAAVVHEFPKVLELIVPF